MVVVREVKIKKEKYINDYTFGELTQISVHVYTYIYTHTKC
jgi:hypothetical protein